MALKQEQRFIAINTPLGKDVLALTGLSGHEEISRLFAYDLEMVSEKESIAAEEIVGKNVTITIRLADDSPRYCNGFVSRFTADYGDGNATFYRAEVVPWLWFLTRTADCRIFQNKTIPQIIEQIFSDLGFSDYETSEIKGEHKEWEYCVQYRETDFNFVSRLLEQEGIFYYFRHEDGKHTLVLADQVGAYRDAPEREVECPDSAGSYPVKDHITDWKHEYEFTPGKWAQTDYDFKKPSTSLMANASTLVQLPGNSKYEIYDYPGEYLEKSDGDGETKIRMEEEEVPHNRVNAASTCRTFTPGGKFTLTKHGCPAEEGKSYVITSIRHAASDPTYSTGGGGQTSYQNSFTCIPDSVVFRPARSTPKSLVSGIQTAVVVGPKGEEIYCDEFGRVKVQFHWDREGQTDDKSSCWIRVAHNIAGKKWGFMAIPRIGQEVVVDFLEGDPDRPLIVGSVYNAEQMPHYKLPDEQTKTYIKTNSSKSGDGFNELRFEDKKDKEQIFLHAQRNLDARVRADSMESVGGNRHLIVGGQKNGSKTGDQHEMVYRDRHETVHRNQEEHIGGDMTLMIGGIDGPGNQDIVVKKNKTERIDADNHLHVKGNRNEKVGVTQSLTVGTDQQEKVGMNHALDAGMNIHLKAGMNVVIEAGMTITLKAGGGFVVVGPTGVTISGTPVLLNSGGAAGAGAGSSPASPNAAKEAAPVEPTAADDAKTGLKSAPD